MASTNQSPQYQKAQANFLSAQTNSEKLYWLEEMIRECPKHKSAEKMLANLRTRYIKLKKKIEIIKKTSKGGGKQGIKKEGLQAVIIGFTNTGKSSLISSLTNTKPEISSYEFTTQKPIVGMMDYDGVQIQLIEIPAINSEYYDKGLVNNADLIIILVNKIEQIEEIKKDLLDTRGKKLIAFNINEKTDLRKIEATLKSKKLKFLIINTESKKGFEEFKEKVFENFGKIRIYTKEPGKEKSKKPYIFEPRATVKEIAIKVFHDISKIKETKIWGPSSKFPGQIVGLSHELKDLDIVEFKTK